MKANLVCFLIMFLSCSKEIKNKESVDKKIDFTSIEEFIFDETFGQKTELTITSLNFYKNYTYMLSYGTEGFNWMSKGKFKIIHGSISLESEYCEFLDKKDSNCEYLFNRATCEIINFDESIEYKFECKFSKSFGIFNPDRKDNKIFVFIKKFKLPIGTLKKYKEFNIFTLGNTFGIVKENLNIRNGPGLNYKKKKYTINYFDSLYLNSIPKGKKILIHARSVEKDKIQNWENYWLLISIDDSLYVWVFGEFVEY